MRLVGKVPHVETLLSLHEHFHYPVGAHQWCCHYFVRCVNSKLMVVKSNRSMLCCCVLYINELMHLFSVFSSVVCSLSILVLISLHLDADLVVYGSVHFIQVHALP